MSTTVTRGITRNWKTTVLGIAAAFTVVGQQLVNLLDNDPATIFSWELFWTGGIIALIGLFAKDGNKSTEDVSQ